MVLTNPDVVGMIKSTFDIGSIEDRKGKQTNWLTLNYQGFPPVATVVKLSKMQADIKRIETEYYSSVLKVKLKKIKGDGSDMIKEKPKVADNSLNTEKTIVEPNPEVDDNKAKTKKDEAKKIEKLPTKEKTNDTTTNQVKFHTVKKGETMYQISRKYKISTSLIKKLNGMTNNNLLVGQRIKVAK